MQPNFNPLRIAAVCFALAVTLAACGGGGGGNEGATTIAGVGQECSSDTACDAGLLCQECAAACTGAVQRCAGFASTAQFVSLDDGLYPASCEDISGAWSLTEVVDGECVGEDQDGPFSIPINATSSAVININQNGCAVSFTVTGEGFSFERRGVVVGSRARFTGPFLLAQGSLALSRNEVFIEGTVDNGQLSASGEGFAAGTVEGFPITCEATSFATGFRQ